jgi:outer membrane biosynthesis protein TonB
VKRQPMHSVALLAVTLVIPATTTAQDRWTEGVPSRLCTQADRDPIVVSRFDANRMFPTSQPWHDFYGQAAIEVTVAPDGSVQQARYIVFRMTPNFESSVLSEARRMRFQPALRNCAPVVGRYRFFVIAGDPFEQLPPQVRQSQLRAEDRASGLTPSEIIVRLAREQQ